MRNLIKAMIFLVSFHVAAQTETVRVWDKTWIEWSHDGKTVGGSPVKGLFFELEISSIIPESKIEKKVMMDIYDTRMRVESIFHGMEKGFYKIRVRAHANGFKGNPSEWSEGLQVMYTDDTLSIPTIRVIWEFP